MDRRTFLAGVAASAVLGSNASFAADGWPNRTITVLVGLPPGGLVDLLNRAVIGQMSKSLGVQMISVPTPGAGGIVALQKLIETKPDGNTLLLTSTNTVLARPIQMQVPLNIEDVTVIGTAARSDAFIYVRKDSAWQTLNDLIAAAKAQPDRYSYATPGVAGTNHLGMAEVARLASIKLVQVGYPGSPQAILSVIGKQNDIVVTDSDNKDLRALVTLSETRSKYKPDVPTLRESGFDFALETRFFLVGPKNLPSDIAQRLENELRAAIDAPNVRQQIAKLELEPAGESGADLMQRLKRELPFYRRLIESLGLIEKKS